MAPQKSQSDLLPSSPEPLAEPDLADNQGSKTTDSVPIPASGLIPIHVPRWSRGLQPKAGNGLLPHGQAQSRGHGCEEDACHLQRQHR